MTKKNSKLNSGYLSIFGILGIALAIFLAISGTIGAASVTNIALNAEVTTNGGTFFTGGWGGGLLASPSTIVDGAFFPQNNQWDQGPVWWDSNDGQDRYIKINLDGIYNIESFVVQADDNDAYELYYWDLNTNTWQLAWNIPNYDAYGWGMQTRPNPSDNTVRYMLTTPITTNALKFNGNMNNGDKLFSVSEIQAYGQLAVVPVNIDIKPGSYPNSFNNNEKGVIPVAILGSADLNVRNINQDTVMLEGLAVKAVGKGNKLLAHYEDVNGEGYEDLVVQIEDSDAIFSEGCTTAKLSGNLNDGTPFEGTDEICIVP